MIRFWDTSALVKAFHKAEPSHARATNLIYRAGKSVRPMTSMLVVVELVAALVRETRDRRLAAEAVELMKGFEQVEFASAHRDLAVRLAFMGTARGADIAIASQALAVAAAGERVEFVTADREQARALEIEAGARHLALRLHLLPA